MTKKTIQKPENWQDFESLCKKLWGEIFEIPNKIKKNGRSGQIQHGVDVYGIPKGETGYVGIQCKGKDDYAQKKLTQKEVDKEIEKAKLFKPALETLIFATSANKDSTIEEYIRLKDIENDFEILLYCWEDIADLIEENRNTYAWYVNDKMHKTKFNFQVLFNEFEESITLQPTLAKKITKYEYIEKTTEQIIRESKLLLEELGKTSYDPIPSISPLSPFFKSETINKSWVEFDLILENSGNTVIEDWSFNMKFTSGVYHLDDESTGDFFMKISFVNVSKDDPRYIDAEKLEIFYTPTDSSVLIQKATRHFKISILTEIEAEAITFEWNLYARDFDTYGEKTIKISPKLITTTIIEEAINEEEVREEVSIDYYREKR